MRRTTSTIDTLDPGGAVVQRRVIGHDGTQRETTLTRDGRGELLAALTTHGGEVLAAVEVQRNLVGWPTQQRDGTVESFAHTTTTFTRTSSARSERGSTTVLSSIGIGPRN